MVTYKLNLYKLLVVLILIYTPGKNHAQDRIYGDFGGGWSSNSALTQTFGSSYIYSEVPGSTGNKYFRYMEVATPSWIQWGPNNGCSADAQTGTGNTYQCGEGCGSKALYVNVTSTSHRWVFKTKNSSDGLTFCFDIGAETIADISNYTTEYSDPIVGNEVTISLNGSQLDGNQGVFLRYTDDNWTSSTISEMTYSSTKYLDTIVSSDVVSNGTIDYYFLISKTGSTISHEESDLFTIAWNNNSGTNYQIKPVDFVYDNGSWNPSSPSFLSSKDILIADDITISSDEIEGDELYFRDDATITLDNGVSPSSTSYSQLKVNSIVALESSTTLVIQEQYISSTGHHGISSPMTTGFSATSGTASSLYEYDASSSGAYVGAYVGNGSASTSTVGRGFFAPVGNSGDFLTAIGEFSVTGTPNTSHDWTLSYVTNSQSGASDNGWNLIGNPYSATLDWNSVSLGSNVNGAIYVWDPANSQYMSWTTLGGVNGGSQYIPPMQAFWVQTTSGGTGTAYDVNTTMSSNTLTTQSPTFQKSQNDILRLSVLDLSNTSKSDETIIANVLGSLDGFDGGLDAWKLPNDGGNPNIYSFDTGDKLAINAVDLSNPKVIPMGIDAPQSGSMYELSLEQVVNADLYEVLLEDKHLNTFTDITKTPYSFQYGGWPNNTPRFNLHLSATNSIGVDEILKDNSYVYQHENQVFIHSEADLYTAYELWAIDGRLIQKGRISTSVTKFTKPQTGLYLIKLIGNSNNYTIKTFLK